MSTSKADLAASIESHTFPVMCAIAQLYLFPNTIYQNHWRQEVWSGLNTMDRLKGSNKLPSTEFIYKNSFEVNKNSVQDAIDWAIDHEQSLVPIDNIDVSHLTTVMDEYFQWLSEKLSYNRYLKSKDVYCKLDELNL